MSMNNIQRGGQYGGERLTYQSCEHIRYTQTISANGSFQPGTYFAPQSRRVDSIDSMIAHAGSDTEAHSGADLITPSSQRPNAQQDPEHQASRDNPAVDRIQARPEAEFLAGIGAWASSGDVAGGGPNFSVQQTVDVRYDRTYMERDHMGVEIRADSTRSAPPAATATVMRPRGWTRKSKKSKPKPY